MGEQSTEAVEQNRAAVALMSALFGVMTYAVSVQASLPKVGAAVLGLVIALFAYATAFEMKEAFRPIGDPDDC